MDKSIIEEIKKILQQKIGKYEPPFQEKGWLLLQYSDPEGFQKLWKIRSKRGGGEEDSGLQKSQSQNDKILVIWDGFPEDSADGNPSYQHNASFRHYITPIDWALAYSRKHKGEKKQEKKPGSECVSEVEAEAKEPVTNCKLVSKIVIFDMCSHDEGDKVKDFHKQALQTMQAWVKFYSFNKMLYGDVCCFPPDITSKIEFKKQDNQQNIDNLSNKWYKILGTIASEDQTRHTINNILDPIQLAELTLNRKHFLEIYNKYPLHTKVFYQSLKWHGRVVAGNGSEEDIEDLYLGGAQVVLVDDHAEHGWKDLLNYWIYKEIPAGNKGICSKTNPDSIISRIDRVKKQYEKERCKLHFVNSKDEILVFDLYLYPLMSAEETEYFKNVIELAGILEVKIDGLIELEGRLEDKEYRKTHRIAYLTLLPQLIAKIDPSIPIIIFSSTEGDRPLKECIEGYENIMTFNKPVIFAKNEDNITSQQQFIEKREEFRKCIDLAMDVIKMRHGLRTLPSISTTDQPNNVRTKDDRDPWRLELYLDETGIAGIHEKFFIGGIYVIGRESAWEQYIDIPNCFTQDKIDFLTSDWENPRCQTFIRDDIKNHKKWKKLPNEHIEKLWRGSKWTQYQLPRNGYPNRDKEKRRKHSIQCLQLLQQLPKGTFNIHAIKIQAPKLACNNLGATNKYKNLESALTKNLNNQNIQKIVQKIKSDTREKFFDEKIEKVLGLKVSNQFFDALANGDALLENIQSEYCESIEYHEKILLILAGLFLHVILPRWEHISLNTIKLWYATVIKETHLTIATGLARLRGYGLKRRNGRVIVDNRGKVRVYTLGGGGLRISDLGYNDGNLGFDYGRVQTEGLDKFSKLHHIADAVLSRPEFMEKSQNQKLQRLYKELYKVPYGMIEKNESLKCFTDANKDLYEGKFVKAFGAILNDSAWKAVEEAINNPNKNTGRYYICTRLKGKYSQVSEPNEFYKLVEKVRSLNNENRNNAGTTNTTANTASSGSANSSKNQTNRDGTENIVATNPSTQKKQNIILASNENSNSRTTSLKPNSDKTQESSNPNYERTSSCINISPDTSKRLSNSTHKNSSSPPPHYQQGKKYFEEENYKEAIKEYKQAMRVFSSGVTKEKQCPSFNFSIKTFDSSLTITIGANHFGARIQIGRCNVLLADSLHEQEKYKEALVKYGEAFEAYQEIPESQTELYKGVQILIALIYEKIRSCYESLGHDEANEYKKKCEEYGFKLVKSQTQS